MLPTRALGCGYDRVVLAASRPRPGAVVIVRGDAGWGDFGQPRGSAPAHRRPALVVSDDAYNSSAIRTVVVCAITSNLDLAAAPGNVALDPAQSGLGRHSVVNVTQIFTVARWLGEVTRDVVTISAVPAPGLRTPRVLNGGFRGGSSTLLAARSHEWVATTTGPWSPARSRISSKPSARHSTRVPGSVTAPVSQLTPMQHTPA